MNAIQKIYTEQLAHKPWRKLYMQDKDELKDFIWKSGNEEHKAKFLVNNLKPI